MLDYKHLVELIENRLQLVPRYRQLVIPVTMGLARPVWADDPDFDINFHIRRAGLPAPGVLHSSTTWWRASCRGHWTGRGRYGRHT